MNSSGSKPARPNRLNRWFSLVDAALCQKRALLPVKKLKDSFLLHKDLHHNLFGFIVFEVAWSDVRGINYLNELQTDTSMALEAKSMKRWEFDSIEQASSCISLWYSGNFYERVILQEYLDGISNRGVVFYDAREDMSPVTPTRANEHGTDDDDVFHDMFCDGSGNSIHFPGMEHTPPASGPCKKRKIMKSSVEVNEVSEEACSEIVSSPTFSVSSSSSDNPESESTRLVCESTNYNDVLILFRFNNPDLPFKFKEIIMSDLRLLRLLEYGLPSWVIFLQSYPMFCQIYRPWMCPLARALYVVISVITVLIGFYDLYKNVPLLKATASRLFGPFFDWIETWEMISRIKYLGTMLFLHNFEKAVRGLLMLTHSTRSLFSFLTASISGPVMEIVEFILPFWNLGLEMVEGICSVIWIVLGFSYSLVMGILQIVVWALWLGLSVVWSIENWVIYPIICTCWEILIAPVRLTLTVASFNTMLFSNTYYFLKEIWSSISILFRFASASKESVRSYEASMWRSLWNDLFSQVSTCWEILIAPVRLTVTVASFNTMPFSNAYCFLKEIGSSISVLFRFASASKESVRAYEASIWGSLWNDLFSQVFHALRIILYGFVAFFTTCNRHRLSIYNHIQELLLRLSHVARSSDSHYGSRRHKDKNPLEESGRSVNSLQSQHLQRRRSKIFEDVGIDG